VQLIVGCMEPNRIEWIGIDTHISSFLVLTQEKHVLERYELRDLFVSKSSTAGGEANWKVLYDEVALDSDHGRTMIHFVAQRIVAS
jgi:hypothetical protein